MQALLSDSPLIVAIDFVHQVESRPHSASAKNQRATGNGFGDMDMTCQSSTDTPQPSAVQTCAAGQIQRFLTLM
jgi:hypothetical protein